MQPSPSIWARLAPEAVVVEVLDPGMHTEYNDTDTDTDKSTHKVTFQQYIIHLNAFFYIIHAKGNLEFLESLINFPKT